MKELIGNTIYGIYRSQDKTILRIDLAYKEGTIFYLAARDCCSDSWFESISYPPIKDITSCYLKVISFEELELLETIKNDNEHEVIKLYGITIKTDRGEIVIDFRNASNGYYGGNVTLVPYKILRKYFLEDWKIWIE